MRISIFLNLFFIITLAKCFNESTSKFKKRFPNFRRQVEELEGQDELSTEKSEEDANINLVAFLVKNAKEIFGETEENTITATRTSHFSKETTLIKETKSEETVLSKQSKFPKETTYMQLFFQGNPSKARIDSSLSRNVTASPIQLDFIDDNADFRPTVSYAIATLTTNANITGNIDNFLSTENNFRFKSSGPQNITMSPSYKFPTRTSSIVFKVNTDAIKSGILNLTNVKPQNYQDEISIYNLPITAKQLNPLRRSCIVCNNVQMQECNEPKNKIVPNVPCENEEDFCYSQQTPFGLIDRGCFNINRNITTYVCSCNLCNYISVSEMPYTFSRKKEWLDNVIDLTRTKNFRTSIYKDMSCLSCEANSTTQATDLLHHVSCFEGNIGVLATTHCADDEICGIKALGNKGYVWRGCLKTPLYNYLWSLCDSDLCNTDPIVSLYEDM